MVEAEEAMTAVVAAAVSFCWQTDGKFPIPFWLNFYRPTLKRLQRWRRL